MMKSRSGFLGAVLLACAAWAGVAQAADHLRVGTPEGSAYVFAPLDVGNGAGIFAKAGLEVEKINFGGGAKLEQAMSAGAIDISVAGNIGLAYATKGVPEKAVAVLAGPPIEMSIIIRSDGDIKKVQNLKGKSIGVGAATSLTAWLALQLSQHEGWGPDGVKRTPIGNMSSMVAALMTKNVDGIVGPVEGGYLLQQKGQGRVLMTFGPILPQFITHGMFASDGLITQHPDTVRRFVHAWFDTIKYMRANKAETIKLTQPVTNLPADIADKVYDLETPALSLDGKFDQRALAATLQSLVDLHQIDALPADTKNLYTTQFLP
jgi:ABC-type nitrate/sulfonate/bicarbonate transport system substrate-binding protein